MADMNCQHCGKEKNRNEFPRDKITQKCTHKNNFCLECTIEHLKSKSTCPDCSLEVPNVDDKIKIYDANLTLRNRAKQVKPQSGEPTMSINVRKLDGETRAFPFSPQMVVYNFMKEVQKIWSYDVKQQTLLYGKNKLGLRRSDGRLATFADYGIANGAILHLVITLLNILADLDHAVFDLFWHYNKLEKNLFIDASCIAFRENQQQPACRVDIDQETAFGGALKHSGDDMDRIDCIGHHCIEVKFQQLPKDITHLYFVLSAWNTPNMKKDFKSVSLKFFDAKDIFNSLCDTVLPEEKLGQQAVIMCCAVCTDGGWRIDEVKVPCSGNVDNYREIEAQITELHQIM